MSRIAAAIRDSLRQHVACCGACDAATATYCPTAEPRMRLFWQLRAIEVEAARAETMRRSA